MMHALTLLLVALTNQWAFSGTKLTPTAEECRKIDPLKWCVLRVSDAYASLEHVRTCADIALVDALSMVIDGYEVSTPLRKSIWRGFEDHVCLVRGGELVISE